MKKSVYYVMIVLMSLIAFPASGLASNGTPVNPAPSPTEVPAHVQTMLNRIDEIKEMDRSELSRAERKELRKEVREINKELRATGNGIYISVGALIIILLLIIIL